MEKQSKKRKGLFFVLLEFTILISCIGISVFSDTGLSEGIRYFIFQFLGILLPGSAVCLLAGIRRKNVVAFLTYSFFFGLLVLIVSYYILALMGLSRFSLVFSVLLAAVSIFILFKKKEDLADFDQDPLAYITLPTILVIIVVCFFSVTLINPLPVNVDSVVYNKDFLYWVGNSISFLKGLPVQTFNLIGIPFYYHYFSNIIIAQSSLITGINIAVLSFTFSYIIPAVMMVFSAYHMLNVLVRNKILIIAGMVFILFTEGSTVFLTDHLYYCSFGFDYAYAIAMMSFAFLAEMYQKDDFSAKNVLISCLLIMVDTGMKGPVSIVVLAAFGIVAFSFLLSRKWKKGFLCGFVWAGSFLLIYSLFLVDLSGRTVQENGLLFLGVTKAFDLNSWAITIMRDLIDNHGYPDNWITRIVSLFLYVFRSSKAAMSLLIISGLYFVYSLIKEKKIDVLLSSLIVVCLWGILLTINTHQDGNSQMYFVMSCFPFAILAGLYAIDRLGSLNRIVLYLLIIIVFLISDSDIRRFIYERAIHQAQKSIAVINGEEVGRDRRYLFTRDDYEMTLWLKENTGSNDLIAVDSFEYDGLRKETLFGVFSERFIWNDGIYSDHNIAEERRAIISEVFSDPGHDTDQLKKEGISYLIQTLSQNHEVIPELGQIVYQSDAYIVYRID